MNKQTVRSIGAIALSAAMLLAPAGAIAAGTPAIIKNKNEIVYATLSPTGSVEGVYTVNEFELSQTGSVTDYGAYTSAVNLTDTQRLSSANGSVSFESDAGGFYYQGNMGAVDLPWTISTSYSLDSAAIRPEELAGKSGLLEIKLTTARNQAINPVFYEHYVLQITITLDTKTCEDIDAPGATIASAGANTVAVFSILPKKDADIRLTANVKDFEMEGITLSALPFSMDMDLPDTDEMVDDFRSLADAISDLNDGVRKLNNGTSDLYDGALALSDGSAEIRDGLGELDDHSGDLADGSAQIRGALREIASGLNSSSGDMDLSSLAELPAGLSQLAQGLDGVAGGMAELHANFTTAYAALDNAMGDIPNASISQEQLQALYGQTDPSQYGLLDQLTAYYSAALTAKGTYDHVKAAFDAVGTTLDTLKASVTTISGTLTSMSAQIGSALSGSDMMAQLEKLKSGMSELADSYSEFHHGLLAYLDGVSELASGYEEFDTGIMDFSEGVGDLKDGVGDLYDGTKELNDEVSDMPDTVQTEIDDMLSDYTDTDFTPVSFTSPLNTHTGSVQFVLKCAGIEKPEARQAEEPVEVKPATIWERFLALFQ
jgi:putative membrane protein